MAARQSDRRIIHYISSDSDEEDHSDLSSPTTSPGLHNEPTSAAISIPYIQNQIQATDDWEQFSQPFQDGKPGPKPTTRANGQNQDQPRLGLPIFPSSASATRSPHRLSLLKSSRERQSPMPASNRHHHRYSDSLFQSRRPIHPKPPCPHQAIISWAYWGGMRILTVIALMVLGRQLNPIEVWVEEDSIAESGTHDGPARFNLSYSWDINGLFAAFILGVIIFNLRHIYNLY